MHRLTSTSGTVFDLACNIASFWFEYLRADESRFCMSAGKAAADRSSEKASVDDEQSICISSDEEPENSKQDGKKLAAKLGAEISAGRPTTAILQFHSSPNEFFQCLRNVLIDTTDTKCLVYNLNDKLYEELQRYIKLNHVCKEDRQLPQLPRESYKSCIMSFQIYKNDFFAGLPDALRARITKHLHMTFELIINDTHEVLKKTKIGGNAVEFDVTFERVEAGRPDIPRNEYRMYKLNPKRTVSLNDSPMGIFFAIITEDLISLVRFNTTHLDKPTRRKTGVGSFRRFFHAEPKENATLLGAMGKFFPRERKFSMANALLVYTYKHLQHVEKQMMQFDSQIMAALFTLQQRYPNSDDFLWLISKCLWTCCHGPNSIGRTEILKFGTFNLHVFEALRNGVYKRGFYCASLDIAVGYAINGGLNAQETSCIDFLMISTDVYIIADGSEEAPPNGQLIAIADAGHARKAQNLMQKVNKDGDWTPHDVVRQWHLENQGDPRLYFVCIHPEKALMIGEVVFHLCDVLKLNNYPFCGIHPDKIDSNGLYKIGPPIVQDEIDTNDGGGSSKKMAEVYDSTKTVQALTAAHVAASAAATAASAAAVVTALMLNTSGGSFKQPGGSSKQPGGSSKQPGGSSKQPAKSILRHPPPKMLVSKRARDPSNGAAEESSGKHANRGYVSNGAAAAGSGAAAAGSGAAAAGSGNSGKRDVVNVYHISTGAEAAGSGAAAANNAVPVAGAASSAASHLCPCKTPNCTMSKTFFSDHEKVAELIIYFASNPPKTQTHHQNSQLYQDNRKILFEAFEKRLQHTNQIEKLYNPNDRTHKDAKNGSGGKKMLGDKYKYAHEDHNLRVIFTDFKEFVRDNDFLKTEFDNLI